VVNPTIGLPLLLGSVALTSLAVHTAVMTHTTWMGSYWMGAARTRVTDATPPVTVAPLAAAGFSITVTPVAAVDAATPATFTINVTPSAVSPPPASIRSASVE